MQFGGFAKQLERYVVNNSPAILTAIGALGTVTTAVLTAKATISYVRQLAEEGYYDRDYKFDRSAREHVEQAWKFYIPPVVTGALTVTAIIGANRISSRRAAALAAAFTLSQQSFDEYRTKIIEKMGEKKEQAARDEIAQSQLDRKPASQQIIISGRGKVLCFDSFIGRYFESDMESLRKAQNDVNAQIIDDHYASLTDFYDALGLPQVEVSNEVGWNLDKMLDLKFTTGLSDENRPCIVISFEVSPAGGRFRCL